MLKNSAGKLVTFITCIANNAGEYVHFMQKKLPKLALLYTEHVITDFSTTEKNVQTKILHNFPSLTSALSLTDSLLAAKIQRVNEYKIFLDSQLSLLIKESEAYEDGVKPIRSKIASLRKKLAKLNSEGASSSERHARLFSEMMDPLLRKNVEGQDLYNSELGILSNASLVKKTQRELVEEIVNYREKVLKLERSRFSIAIKVFKEFLDKSGENLGEGMDMREAREGWVKVEFDKDLEGFLDWGKVLDGEDEKNLMEKS
jgi:hypothetical protein